LRILWTLTGTKKKVLGTKKKGVRPQKIATLDTNNKNTLYELFVVTGGVSRKQFES